MLSKIIKWILLQAHTFFLLVGITFISIAAFLVSIRIGFLVSGVCLVIIGYLIDSGRR